MRIYIRNWRKGKDDRKGSKEHHSQKKPQREGTPRKLLGYVLEIPLQILGYIFAVVAVCLLIVIAPLLLPMGLIVPFRHVFPYTCFHDCSDSWLGYLASPEFLRDLGYGFTQFFATAEQDACFQSTANPVIRALFKCLKILSNKAVGEESYSDPTAPQSLEMTKLEEHGQQKCWPACKVVYT